jgi:hypothetical protein
MGGPADVPARETHLFIQRLQCRVHASERQMLSHHIHEWKRWKLAAAHSRLKLSQGVFLIRLNVKGKGGGTEIDRYFLVFGVQSDGGEQ